MSIQKKPRVVNIFLLTKLVMRYTIIAKRVMKRGDYMNKANKEHIEKTVQILNKLDEKSLLLIVSGAKLLAARQEMDNQKEPQET